ncbi:Imm49 family immunity protein [Actinoallomurus iriomotensis]|uniref:Uncharacterized protein n=1 Tax=Actinoallomurus iriomotensis TaxID=478107 RepID=A0A9W6RLL0_9ACTN|nr:Imm49 family immunity protein [Actinoallomurus iriomotensis]GLY78446.1 hypothetical protein Airi01_067130 [Actinoallomurus iriomotensis]
MSRSTQDAGAGTVADLYARVERAAAAADRTGAVGLPPLTDALLDYLDGLSAQDPTLDHPHARPAVRTATRTTHKYFTACLPHISPGQCELPLLNMSVGVSPDETLGGPFPHDWVQAFELALVCRSYVDADALHRQRFVLQRQDAGTDLMLAYTAALVALWKRKQWPRNRKLRTEVKADLQSALEVLSGAPADSAWTPRVRVLGQLAAGKNADGELAAAVTSHAESGGRRIAWDLLALASLAEDLGLPMESESDFLPRHLRVWPADR